MQSHNPAPPWYPTMVTSQPLRNGQYHSWTGYGTPGFFSPGSSSVGHATLRQHSDPTAGGDATGSMYSSPGYPYTLSVMTFKHTPAELSFMHSALSFPSVISQPTRVAARQAPTHYPTMAIQQHPTTTPTASSHSHARPIETLNVPVEREATDEHTLTPPSQPSSQDESSERPNSKSSEKKMHPCWMCHKSFDR